MPPSPKPKIRSRAFGTFSDGFASLLFLAHLYEDLFMNAEKQFSDMLAKANGWLQGPHQTKEQATENLPSGYVAVSVKDIRTLTEAVERNARRLPKAKALMPAMLLVHGFALFDGYLNNITIEFIKAKPEVLKSRNRKLDYEIILNCSDHDALISTMAEREVHELGYSSLSDYRLEYKNRFGIDIALDEVTFQALAESNATRNILVHNNGMVNSRYLALVKDSPILPGQDREVTGSYLLDTCRVISRTVAHVDIQAVTKFHLGT